MPSRLLGNGSHYAITGPITSTVVNAGADKLTVIAEGVRIDVSNTNTFGGIFSDGANLLNGTNFVISLQNILINYETPTWYPGGFILRLKVRKTTGSVGFVVRVPKKFIINNVFDGVIKVELVKNPGRSSVRVYANNVLVSNDDLQNLDFTTTVSSSYDKECIGIHSDDFNDSPNPTGNAVGDVRVYSDETLTRHYSSDGTGDTWEELVSGFNATIQNTPGDDSQWQSYDPSLVTPYTPQLDGYQLSFGGNLHAAHSQSRFDTSELIWPCSIDYATSDLIIQKFRFVNNNTAKFVMNINRNAGWRIWQWTDGNIRFHNGSDDLLLTSSEVQTFFGSNIIEVDELKLTAEHDTPFPGTTTVSLYFDGVLAKSQQVDKSNTDDTKVLYIGADFNTLTTIDGFPSGSGYRYPLETGDKMGNIQIFGGDELLRELRSDGTGETWESENSLFNDLTLNNGPNDDSQWTYYQLTTAPPPANTYDLSTQAGSFTVTHDAVTLAASKQLTAQTSTYTLTHDTVTLARQLTSVVNPGTFNYSGGNATIAYEQVNNYTLTTETSSVSYVGGLASQVISRVLAPATGVFSLSGEPVTLDNTVINNYTLATNTSTFVTVSSDVDYSLTRTLATVTGTFTVTHSAVQTTATRTRTVTGATYTLTDTTVPLSYSPVNDSAFSAQTGTFTVTGDAVNTVYVPANTFSLSTQPSTFTTATNTIDLSRGLVLETVTDFIITEYQDINTAHNRTIIPTGAIYSYTGGTTTFGSSVSLFAETGTYTLADTSANITLSGTATRTITEYELSYKSLSHSSDYKQKIVYVNYSEQ